MSNDNSGERMPILGAVLHSMNGKGHGVLPLSVPMEWLNEETAQSIHSQSLKKLKSRGGMSYSEIVCNMIKGDYNSLQKLDEYKCMVYLRNKIEKDPNPAQQFTSKDEVYAAHQAIVDALGGHRGKELDLLVKLAHTAIAGIRETPPQPAVQFTAEEMFHLVVTTERDKVDIISAMEQYAAQQTASKDEEIASLREMFSNCVSLLQGFPIAEPGDFDIGGRHHDWYCKRCDLLEGFRMFGTGVLGWRQTKEDRIRELEAQLEASETCRELEATKDKDARIKELEEALDIERYNNDHAKKVIDQQDARIKDLVNQITILSHTQSSAITEMKRVEDQRDEAVNLLKGARSVISSIKLSMMAHPDHEDGSEFDDMTSKAQEMEDLINNRLVNYFKSGETKPPEDTAYDEAAPCRICGNYAGGDRWNGESFVHCEHCNGKGIEPTP